MSELPGLNTRAKTLLRSCEELLARMERGESQASHAALGQVELRLKDLKGIVQQMETIFASAFSMSRADRQSWKRKVDSLIGATGDIERGINRYKSNATRRQRELDERAELLSGASTSQAYGSLDDDSRALGHARQARRGVEEMLQGGAAILGQMGATRESLKNTQRKVLDVINALGISDNILRLADRRQKGDAVLVYGGMAVVTAVVLLFMYWYG